MRGLNLSRLARASESSFFKNEQTQQAINIRSKLSLTDLNKLKQNSLEHTVSPDILPEISAHSTYRDIIAKTASTSSTTADKIQKRPLFVRLANPPSHNAANVAPVTTTVLDGNMMQALGSRKLELVPRNSAPQRPLPGGEKYGDGAVIGIASFSIASAVVAATGLLGGLVLWSRPGIIANWKDRSNQFKRRLENGTLGTFVKKNITPRVQQGSGVLSDETKQKATSFARAAVGVSAVDEKKE